MTKEIRFTRALTAADERTYARLSFELPAGVERIEVDYEYPRFYREDRPEGRARVEANIVDLGLYDEGGRLRGWSGSERLSIFVSEATATPGYRCGPLAPGSWAVVLGIYRVGREAEVSVRVRLVDKTEVLFAGDLHLHTRNSDGVYSTPELIAQCKAAGLDFIALTDHNNTEQNREIGKPEGILVIPGMEYTNYRGHANFFFRDSGDFGADPLSSTPEEALGVFRAAKERGALISLNHPHCDNCPWELGFEGLPYDLVEVWNGPMKASELRAIAWWQSLLASGRRLPAIGGSDTHRHEPYRGFGFPTTFLRAASASRSDLLEALLAGRASISATRSGPRLDLRLFAPGREASLGGELLASRGEKLEGRLSVFGARKGELLRLIDGRGLRSEWSSPFDGELELGFEAEADALFYRAELWRPFPQPGQLTLFALSNPVYIRRE